MPETKGKKQSKNAQVQQFDAQALSALQGLRIVPQDVAQANNQPAKGSPERSSAQASLVEKLIDFIKTMD